MARPTQERIHLFEKRNEIIWALDHQGYRGKDISVMFNNLDESIISRTLKKKLKRWQPKWIKVNK